MTGVPVAVPRDPGLGRLSETLSRLLIAGALLSTVLLIIGIGAALGLGSYQSAAVLEVWGGAGSSWTSVGGDAEPIILVGLFALVGVPLSRVVVSCWTFFQIGDRDFARLTALVLVIITAAAVVGWLLPNGVNP